MSSSWSLLSFVDSSWLLKAIVLACAAIAGIWVLRKNSERVFSTAEKDEPDLRCPLDSASLVERLSFRWVTPLLTVCRERSITDNDLWELKDEDSAAWSAQKFGTTLAVQTSAGRISVSPIQNALFHAFGALYIRAGAYKLASDLLYTLQPHLLRQLVIFITDYQSGVIASKTNGFVIAGAMLVLQAIQAVCFNQYESAEALVRSNVRSALIMAIYEKTLKLSSKGREDNAGGVILNLIGGDVGKIENVVEQGHKIWSIPLQVGLILYGLYKCLGLTPILLGLGGMVLMGPLNKRVMKRLQHVQSVQIKNRDARTRLLTEILTNMKNIKLLGYMPFFNYKLTSTRNDRELKTLKEQGLSLAMANFVWSTGPFLVSFISFATSAITQTSGTSMKAESVFPALALLALLHNPLAAFPYVISAIGDGKIAIGRIEKFLSANEVQDNTPDRQVADNQTYLDNNDAITVKDAIFSWSYNPEKPSLIVPSLAFQRGGFYCITGTVGSGKSTLLQAFLGEVPKPRGTFKVQGSIAYVSQTPWIITGSIKENILFGHVLQPEVYDTVVAACGLNEDFATLMDGDETKVGGQGMNLSGGQKARVALARAIYARREIYMMDDVLSAVDQGVRRHLIENVLGPNGLLRSKTRILVTHSEEVLSLVDDIVTVKDGKAVQSGQQREIEERNEDSENLESERNGGNSTTQPLRTKDPAELAIPQPRQKGRILQRNEQKAKSPASSAPSTRGKRSSWHLCKTYFYASTPPAILLYLAILVLARLMIISSDIWIKIWIEDTKNEDNKYNVWVYVGIYFVLGIGAAILAACQLAVLLIGASLRASKNFHERMSHAMFNAPMSFFETTAFGSILSRFTDDIYRIDDRLARSISSTLSPFVLSTMILVIISRATPPMAPFLLIPIVLYLSILRSYLPASRVLTRLEGTSKGLSYTHFQSTLTGLSTIRAFGHQSRFATLLEKRLDTNLRAVFASQAVQCWLKTRLQLIGAGISSLIALIAVMSLQRGEGGVSAAMIGLALVNAQKMNGVLNLLVQTMAMIDAHVVSLERVVEFTGIASEGSGKAVEPPETWPEKGDISFCGVSARYRDGLEESLSNIELKVEAGERIGIVGRTGAGKSSLAMALFRIIEPTQGYITIDGQNISNIPLQTLRSRLAMIPQDAPLFTGTVRSNLDPFNISSDEEIWNVLTYVHLALHISALPRDILTEVKDSDSVFSVGQRQLLSLARALLSNARILILDEATASVDLATDHVLQDMLRSDLLKGRTVITIAHRMNTIIDSDRVVVLDAGKVVEFGTPKDLARREGGVFRELMVKAGLGEELILS